jgi:hypothetical protein
MKMTMLLLCALLDLPGGVACAGKAGHQGSSASGVGPPAPNGTVVTARVTDARIVKSTTLGIEPEQPICLLTLVIISSKASKGLVPALSAGGAANAPIQVYSKEDLVSLKGGRLTALITRRGAGRAARLWVVEVLASPPRR